MDRSRGFRSKTRKKLSGGRFSIAESLQDFDVGQKVVVKINAAVHKGMPFPRFHGNLGVVKEKRGNSFVLDVKSGNATKTVIARPEHLMPFKE